MNRNAPSAAACAAATGFIALAAIVCISPIPVAATQTDTPPAFSNRLANESSPYLLLHAHNPVDWYPWGEEAFAKARREDKPIFLSVGYSTCYWCHVMEREVFADPEIAALMNQWFVNIKVDREERPDVDQIYMMATQLLSRHGGWPNSVFMTPQLKPFYAGTYFPPEDKYGRPGFPRVLRGLHEYWEANRGETEATAQRLTDAIREHQAGGSAPPQQPDSTIVTSAVAATVERYDATHGGFGGAPKFPPSMRLDLLMDRRVADREQRAAGIVAHTLRAMANGGIYDQVGGGFHRYATDIRWRVPHFEKMLYNQAQLARAYARAYALSGEEQWRFVVADIFRYVAREMTSPDGAFYSALDAETETVEGKYYVWSEEEIYAVLGPEDAELFFDLYQLAPMPEGEGGVVFRHGDFDRVAEERNMTRTVLDQRVEELRALLRSARDERTYPLLDDKILTSWNGMMIAAYAEAAAVFDNDDYRRTAERAARFIADRLISSSGAIRRVYRNDVAKQRGFLDDYAYYAQGLMALHEATGDDAWLTQARQVSDEMIARFWDPASAGFHYSEGGSDLIARSKNGADSALPSANAVATLSLLQLARASGDGGYRERAAENLRVFGGAMRANPAAFMTMTAAAVEYLAHDQKGHATATEVDELMLWETGPAAPTATAVPPLPQTIVDVTVTAGSQTVQRGASTALEVALDIAAGWHLNANPASSDWLIPTSLIANSDLPVLLTDVSYPPGKPVFLRALDETLSVYDGTVVLTGQVAAKPEAGPAEEGELRLLLQYQACDDHRCLAPATVSRIVRLAVE